MTCGNVTGINLIVSPYDTGVDLNLTAPTAGDYTVIIEFNGTYQRIILTLTSGEDIILPTLNTQNQYMINGDYNHLTQILLPNGSLLNNTCYSLNCRSVSTAGNGLTPSPTAKGWTIVVATQNSASLTNAFLLTNTISEIVTNNQSYLVGSDFTQSGDTVTWINGNFFTVSQVIKLIV